MNHTNATLLELTQDETGRRSTNGNYCVSIALDGISVRDIQFRTTDIAKARAFAAAYLNAFNKEAAETKGRVPLKPEYLAQAQAGAVEIGDTNQKGDVLRGKTIETHRFGKEGANLDYLTSKIVFKDDGTGYPSTWNILEELKREGGVEEIESGEFDNYGSIQPFTTYRLRDGRHIQQIFSTWSEAGFTRIP